MQDRRAGGDSRHRVRLLQDRVLGRNSIPFAEMLEIDYGYVAGWSLWHDVRLLLRTVPVVLRQRGAN